MIFKLKQWCEGIIIAIVISVIIEMLIPDNKNKKYVKVIIGIYIMFVSLNPLLEILNYDIDFEKILKTETITTSSNFDNRIKDVYVLGIEEKIKEEIEELGYDLEYVQVQVDSNYEQIEKISLKINGILDKKNILKIDEINISENKNLNQIYSDVISLLSINYCIEEEKIEIK